METPNKRGNASDHQHVEEAIGAMIRSRRQSLALTQGALGERIGVSFQQIQKYERGYNRVAVSTLLNLAIAMECTVTDLLPVELLPADDVVREIAISINAGNSGKTVTTNA
jgi:transcriptional regulator with XRE-family HTH domain